MPTGTISSFNEMDSCAVGLADLVRTTSRLHRFWHCKCSKTNKAIEEVDQSSIPMENTMRSERVFAAMAYVPNRFLLVKLAAKATRKFHRPNTRIEETMNDVLVRFSEVNPIAGAQETGNVRRLRRTEKAKTYSRYARRSQAVA